MAVRTLYGRSAKAPNALYAAAPVFAEGRPRALQPGNFAILNGDSANSKLYLGKISSAAIPVRGLATVIHSAITSLNDVDIGVEKDGVTVDIDVFADGLDMTAAGTKDPFAGVGVADVGKRVYELLGLANDPGVEYDVVLTLKAATTAAGSIAPQLLFAIK